LSSILAKVHRDLFMEKQEGIYPQFGFAKHKGYGTALHFENIQKHGVCPLHRQSFLKNVLYQG
ncbi:MAG: ribonuclease HII, partial [Bdellovibrionota bacterium]